MERFEQKKNFNITSTVINDNIRVSTAAIFYDEVFGERFQFETIVFRKDKGMLMKIHNVYASQKGLDYCVTFHNKLVSLINSKIK